MVEDRSGHTATLMADGRVLIVGGNDNYSTDIFDPATGQWYYSGTQ